MFERLARLAERSATRVSRRRFLGRLGNAALTAVGALGGILALPAISQGGRARYICPEGSWWRCVGQVEGFPCDYGSACKRRKRSTLCDCVG